MIKELIKDKDKNVSSELIDYKYTIFTTILLGILGALVFFIWGMINSSFSYSYSINAAINAGLIFAVLGFILGILVGNRK